MNSASLKNLPDVWGDGILFAFSGIDGPTDAGSGFVLTTWPEKFQWLIQTPQRRIFSVKSIQTDDPGCHGITGDVFISQNASLVFTAWHTLAGQAGAEVQISLSEETGDGCPEGISRTPEDALVLLREGDRFALSYGRTPEEARRRAQAGLKRDIQEETTRRLDFLRKAPTLKTEKFRKFMHKLLSVMKVNSLSPEGAIQSPWSTPDRVPHKILWLWDSVFHSFAMNRINPLLAWQYIQAVLQTQRPDGMISHMIHFNGVTSRITQPPILAWGIRENYQYLRDEEKLRVVFEPLERYLEWNLANRDENHNSLFEWFITDNASCRSDESGMDNSSRFDAATRLDSLDFSVFMANDAACLAEIAEILHLPEKAESWRNIAQTISSRIHSLLWNEEQNIYGDRFFDGTISPVQAVSGFLPLLLHDIPAERVDALIRTMSDPARFASKFPLPSIALSDPTWSRDMWRGPTWINFNYLTILGLERQGRHEKALELARVTIQHVRKYYERFGVVFEFYDARDDVPPTLCERHGPSLPQYDVRKKIDPIRDYHWTAALTYILLMDYDGRL
ncbi:MAG: hypothetical protein JXA11_12655 [Phycisphaerae bacterium]|nr:hypothetical protein [Phycisphaerae bacterium]